MLFSLWEIAWWSCGAKRNPNFIFQQGVLEQRLHKETPAIPLEKKFGFCLGALWPRRCLSALAPVNLGAKCKRNVATCWGALGPNLAEVFLNRTDRPRRQRSFCFHSLGTSRSAQTNLNLASRLVLYICYNNVCCNCYLLVRQWGIRRLFETWR